MKSQGGGACFALECKCLLALALWEAAKLPPWLAQRLQPGYWACDAAWQAWYPLARLFFSAFFHQDLGVLANGDSFATDHGPSPLASG